MKARAILVLALAVLAPPTVRATGPEVEISLAGGKTHRGTLLELDERHVKLVTPEGEIAQPTSQLLSLAPAAPPAAGERPAPPQTVTLTDGTVIPAALYLASDGTAHIKLPGRDEALLIPTGAIAHVDFRGAEPRYADEFAKIVAEARTSDALVVVRGESLDYLDGVIGNVEEETIHFELDGEAMRVKRSKASGLIYFHPADDLPGAVGIAHATDGRVVALHKFHLADDGRLSATTPAGVEFRFAPEDLTRIDFSQGKIVYLGELRPESSEWTPYLGTPDLVPSARSYYEPRVDTAFNGLTMQIQGTQFQKGIALRARTVVVYRLPGKFGRFLAVAGIDDSVRPQGDVRLEIRADERVLLETRLDGRAEPLPIDLDISGANRLTIVVDYGEDLDVGDQLDLGDARIAK